MPILGDDDAPFLDRSTADRAVAWYRAELPLRRAVALLALPALAGLTGFGLLVDPGPISLLPAILTFIAAGELFTTSRQLRRRRDETPGPTPPRAGTVTDSRPPR